MGKFGISKGYMFLLLTCLSQAVDNIAQNMQRSIDIAALPQPLPLNIRMFNSLTPCQIHDMQFCLLGGNGLILKHLALYQNTKNGMRPGTFGIHLREGCFPGFFAFKE